MIPAPTKYAELPGNPSLAYDAICKTLSERQAAVDWAAFTQDDWQLFARMAETEGVAPLLHWIWKTGVRGQGVKSKGVKDEGGRGEGEWPSEVREFLQASYYKTAAHNALLFQELERILAAFEAAEIPVIVLKGAALAQTIYANPGLRPMGDIDLMVDPKHLGRSLQILDKLGFALWKMTYHAMLVKGGQPSLTVELHWCLHSQRKEANTSKVLFGSDPDTNLKDAQAHFLYLCAHLFYQHYGPNRRLLWGYDLYALMTAREIDWEILDAQAERLGWEEARNAVLAWLHEIFEESLPIRNFEAAERRSPESRETVETNTASIHNWIRQSYTILPARQKFTWLRGMLFPSPAYVHWRYHPEPEWLWPFCFLRRWWEIANETSASE